MRGVVCCSAVAVAAGLLVAGVDVAATGADAAIEERELLVCVGVAAISTTLVALMIVGERRMRSQVQPTATARPLVARVNMSAASADTADERTAVIGARVAAPAENQRARRLNIATARRAEPLGMPVDVGRASGA